jgi:uncharacterized protein YqgQ
MLIKENRDKVLKQVEGLLYKQNIISKREFSEKVQALDKQARIELYRNEYGY